MSLVKQLWLGTVILLSIVLSGSFIISTMTARHYLEQQLQLKNIDTATSMALSLSQMEKDLVTVQLLVSAQFDTGHYASIRLEGPEGEVLAQHSYSETGKASSPVWFNDLMSIDVSPGIAQVQDGWQQYGTLFVESHSRFAYESLWNSTVHFIEWLLVVTLVCGLIGTLILKNILKPLLKVISQAESIGQQQFVTFEEPKTHEFRLLVQAMNKLSSRVKKLLGEKTRELELLHQHAHLDPLTQLANRGHFLKMLDTSISREDSQYDGVLYLIRINKLADINLNFSHATGNKILQMIAETLQEVSKKHRENYAGRLNGTDFAFVCFGNKTVTSTANDISQKIAGKVQKLLERDEPLDIPIAGCHFQPSSERRKLLSLLDGTLTRAEQKGNNSIIALEEHTAGKSKNSEDWRNALNLALDNNQISLGNFPVCYINGDFLHSEMPVRLKLDSKWQPAGYFIGWAIKHNLLQKIDLQVLKIALLKIENTQEQVAINLSEDALCNTVFCHQVEQILRQQPQQARYLWIDFQESCAVRNPVEFRRFSLLLKDLGCRVGLEHVGFQFDKIEGLHDLGLRYLKVDNSIINEIDKHDTNHEFLKSLCSIGHSLGIIMIAEGVSNSQEKDVLKTLHIDAVTGPGIS